VEHIGIKLQPISRTISGLAFVSQEGGDKAAVRGEAALMRRILAQPLFDLIGHAAFLGYCLGSRQHGWGLFRFLELHHIRSLSFYSLIA
jgi:hypothetical protein